MFFLQKKCLQGSGQPFICQSSQQQQGSGAQQFDDKEQSDSPPNPQDRLAFVLQIISCYQADPAFTMNAKFQSKQKFEAG